MWTDETLRVALLRADRAADAHTDRPPRLTERVLRVASDRRARRTARRQAVTALTCVLALLPAWLPAGAPSRGIRHPAPGPGLATAGADDAREMMLRREIALLERQALLQAQMVARARRLQSVTSLTASRPPDAPALDPILEVRLQCGQAAAIVLQGAEKLARAAGGTAAAVRRCRWVIELYSGTPWADEARRLLEDLQRGGIS